jgi:hypothetical protein
MAHLTRYGHEFENYCYELWTQKSYIDSILNEIGCASVGGRLGMPSVSVLTLSGVMPAHLNLDQQSR